MHDANHIPVFDGHNDALHELHPFGPRELGNFLDQGTTGHIDLPRARQARFGGGFFAIFVSSEPGPDAPENPVFRITGSGYEMRMAHPVASDVALRGALTQTAGVFDWSLRQPVGSGSFGPLTSLNHACNPAY